MVWRWRIAALPLACLLAQDPQPANRGLQRASAPSGEWQPKRRVVVAIGVDHYRGWKPPLINAVSDATEVADVLNAAGFVKVVEPLLEERATRDAILELIDDTLPAKLNEDDDLVIFFAGHGTSKESKVGGRAYSSGYIIPFDGANPELNAWSTYLPLSGLLEAVGKLPPRHVLLILDSCRSGIALDRIVEISKPDTETRSAPVSRTVITSAGANQDASDSGPVPGHSLFTGILLHGLRTGAADFDKDGAITDAELALYLKGEVKKARGAGQTPVAGQFYAHEAGGEISLPKPKPELLAALDTARTHTAGSGDMALRAGDGQRGPKRTVRQAIVIGCDKYQGDVGDLLYAVADAREVGQALGDLGYEVRSLFNPTRAAMVAALQDAAASAPSKLGSLAVFFAGQSVRDPQSGVRYLLLTDGNPQDIKVSGVSLRDLSEILYRSPAEQKFLFLDAAMDASIGPGVGQMVAPDRGPIAAFIAARPREVPIEVGELGHGVFSYFLIRGLRGAAADPDDGVITLGSLDEYLRSEVRKWTRLLQTPRMFADGADDHFPFGVVRTPILEQPPVPPPPPPLPIRR
jgi:uncharacterized caspase-like protein